MRSWTCESARKRIEEMGGNIDYESSLGNHILEECSACREFFYKFIEDKSKTKRRVKRIEKGVP